MTVRFPQITNSGLVIWKQVYGKIEEGDVFGEVAALCDLPQPFTCRTATLSQLLRISKIRLAEIIQEHREDINILMNNLFKVQLHFLKGS